MVDLQLAWLAALTDGELVAGTRGLVNGFEHDGTLDEEVAAETLAELADRLERRSHLDAREVVLGLRRRVTS